MSGRHGLALGRKPKRRMIRAADAMRPSTNGSTIRLRNWSVTGSRPSARRSRLRRRAGEGVSEIGASQPKQGQKVEGHVPPS